MKALVMTINDTPLTTSLLISEQLEVDHKSTMQLIKKYQTDFDDLGICTFEMCKSEGSKKIKFAYLNEEQALFLLTLMQNSRVVVDLKKKLVTEFIQVRTALLSIKAQKKDAEWVHLRNEGKVTRREFTDICQYYIKYAHCQGSKGADWYFKHYTHMSKDALFNTTLSLKKFRDNLNKTQLLYLDTCETMITSNIQDGILDGIHYKDIYFGIEKKVLSYAEIVGKSNVPDTKLFYNRMPKQQLELFPA